MTHTNSNNSHKPSVAAILMVPVIVALVLTLFAWPASRQKPRDLPIGVAGPTAAAQAIEKKLTTSRPGAFEIHRYLDEAEAREAIEDRDVYGAFVATPAGAKVLTASAASASVSQLLQQAAAGSAGAPQVEDVVPAPKDDPRGSGLASSVLPMVLAGILVGLIAIFLAPSVAARGAVVAAGSVLAGLAAILIAHVFGILEHNWAANWIAMSLIVLAISSVVAGFEALLGAPGIAVGALTTMLIGNPFAGVSSAPEMLPQPVGDLGQLMPPGAGGNLVRSTAFFDGAAAAGHIVVLVAWIVVGAVALLVAAARTRRTAAGPISPARAVPAA